MTAKVMKHEAKRFASMTHKQLTTRLYKLTNMEKLDAFVDFAEMFGYNDLYELAIEKIAFMEGN